MNDSTLRLLFAGGLTVLALVIAGAIALTGMFQSVDVKDVVILAGIFGNVATAGLTYFVGYKNGTNGK